MAHAGQVLENPISGEKITFRQTAVDTDGELLAFELVLAPAGAVPGAHVHPEQEERFEVVSGTLAFRLGLKRVVAGRARPWWFPRAACTVSRTPATSPPTSSSRFAPPSRWSGSWRP